MLFVHGSKNNFARNTIIIASVSDCFVTHLSKQLRTKMLALPVERLVGNSTSKSSSNTSSSSTNTTTTKRMNHTLGLGRNSASPDSSTLTSDLSSSASSSPASSPNKSVSRMEVSPRGSLSPPNSTKSHDLDIVKNLSQNISISPRHSPEPERHSPSMTNCRKRRRSRSSSVESGGSSRRSRSISPGTNCNNEVGKGIVIKQEATSPRTTPPIAIQGTGSSSCHSCCCQQQKSPQSQRRSEADEDEESHFPFRRDNNVSKSSNNNDNNITTSMIPTKIEDDLEECANNNRTNKIDNNRTSAHHIYYHPHHQIHGDGDHHHPNHFNSREEMMRERPSSRSSKLNNNSNNGRDPIENGGGSNGHPSMNSVDNGLSSPGSISSTSSNGRPPSRPPSTASTASSSCFSSVLSLSTSTVTSHNNRSSLHNHFNNYQNHHNGLNHHHHHPSHFLKFSIEDILRPDFGKVHNKNTHGSNVSSSLNGRSTSPAQKKAQQQSYQQPQQHHQETTRPSSRTSSFKYHSDDSNCSSTSRHTEVVDETKVNPKVPEGPLLWPAWVYCTRYSDRPSSGPRSRRIRKEKKSEGESEEKRPRTAFTAEQLARLKQEFEENRYLTEKRRQDLAQDLKLHENQIKIWFQNKRAKLKKSSGQRNGLAMQLMAQGLYNHSTIPVDEDEEMLL